jgi:hypothetical protein
VSSLIGIEDAVSLSTRDTVLWETPARRATSCIVGVPEAELDFLFAITEYPLFGPVGRPA